MSTLPLAPAVGPPITADDTRRPGFLPRVAARIRGRFGYALGDQVVYSFGNMVVAAMLSRHCSPREFGIYILTQRAMDVLIQLCNVFLWGPFSFNLSVTAAEEKARYQGSMLQLQLICCVLFTAILAASAQWTAGPKHADFHETFAPLIVASGGILFREFTRRMYFAQMRMQEAFWAEVATVGLQIAGVEWLFLEHSLSVAHTLYALCAGAVLVSIWWVIRDGIHLRFNFSAIWSDLRCNMRLGRWFLGSNMVFMASSQCNPWILGSLLGGGSVGAYAICESVVNIPRVALTSMQNVMGPAIATAYAEEGSPGVARTVARFNRLLSLGSLAFAFCIWAAGPCVAGMIFKRVPAHSRLLLGLLALNLVVYACTLAQSYGLTALKRADTTFFANLAGLVAQAALCVILIRCWAVPGAAAAMLIGSVVVVCAREAFYRREFIGR